jgi:hypothetical protein
MPKNCWNCKYQENNSGDTFLGRCGWFRLKGQDSKDIPPERVDCGCKFWVQVAKF